MATVRPRLLFSGELAPESPLWTESGVCVDLSSFSMSSDLRHRLLAWLQRGGDLYNLNDAGDGYVATDDDWDSWRTEGRRLYEETRDALAGVADLVWDQED